MGFFEKIKNSLKKASERFKAKRSEQKTEKAIARAVREIKADGREDGPGLIDVASVYRKGRYRRQDIRATQRRFRRNGKPLVLINRPGNHDVQNGRKGYITNKGMF